MGQRAACAASHASLTRAPRRQEVSTTTTHHPRRPNRSAEAHHRTPRTVASKHENAHVRSATPRHTCVCGVPDVSSTQQRQNNTDGVGRVEASTTHLTRAPPVLTPSRRVCSPRPLTTALREGSSLLVIFLQHRPGPPGRPATSRETNKRKSFTLCCLSFRLRSNKASSAVACVPAREEPCSEHGRWNQ